MRFSNDAPAEGIYSEDERVMQRYDAKNRFLAIIASWMNGELSEGQACKLLGVGVSPVDLRETAEEYNTVAREMWKRFKRNGATVDDDMKEEGLHRPHQCSRCND